MRTAKVVVLPYSEEWKRAFEAIKAELLSAVGHLIEGIEHVGSTSVEGLSAKPCIDVDIVIRDYTVFPAVVQGLQQIGYLHEGDLGIKEREAFAYSDKPHLYPHHLYVCPAHSAELHRHLTFRDHLRSHPEDAALYGAVKEEGARLYPNDIDGYIAHKEPCIRALYQKCGLE